MLLKKLFNCVFPENTKSFMRKKFYFFFENIDRYVMCKDYMKACKKILHSIFFYGDAYRYRENSFLKQIRGEYLRILYKSKIEKDINLEKCFEYIDKFGIDTFCYEDMHQEIFSEEDIYFDDNLALYYAFYNGKKLYLKRSIDTAKKAAQLLNSLAIEQLEDSPHRYLTSKFKPDNGSVVFDIGCAEGNLILDIIDSINKAYMFECDEEWVEALNATFEPYKEKVCIISKFVSDNCNENNITIDEVCRLYKISKIDFVKIDVEGYEQRVLFGSKNMLSKKAILKLAVCVYHHFSDESEIQEILFPNYKLEIPERYMAWNDTPYIMELNDQIFTHGIIRATLIEGV